MGAEMLTLGVEEEYLLVDPETREAAANPPPEFLARCKHVLGESVTPEFLQCQIEIATPVCETVDDAKTHLIHMRRTLADIAQDFDLRLMAASSHPFTDWRAQKHTQGERYAKLDADLQGAIRRMLICGTHIHIGIEDPDLRMDVMNQVRYFMPHILALSTSSPFWEGDMMGMKSYRLSVFDGMPRTGVPEAMESYGQYERLVGTLVRAGVIEDASKIWWDLRPSTKFPTLEARVADMCTRIEDTLCITAMYQSLVAMIIDLKKRNTKWRIYPALLIAENRWLAQRHGVKGHLIDFGMNECRPFSELLEELLDMTLPYAEDLGCAAYLLHARTIVERGSSACRQVDTYNKAISNGAGKDEAFKIVVDHLISETVEGL